MTKLKKNSSCDQTQKLKLWQISNTQIVTKLKFWQNSKTLIFTNSICDNSNCDETRIVTKLKLWQNSTIKLGQNLKKGKLWQNSIDDKTSEESVGENYLTPWQPMILWTAFRNFAMLFTLLLQGFYGYSYRTDGQTQDNFESNIGLYKTCGCHHEITFFA